MEFNPKKIPSYIMIATIIAVIIYFNISYFKGYISVNNKDLVDYDLTDEDINPVRETAVAGLFYPADTYQLDKDLDGYLENVPSSLEIRPKIMIVPHAGYMYSAQVAAYAYKRLLPFKDQIKTVFLLGPSHHVFVDGVALPHAQKFKTPLGEVPVDLDIVAELSHNPMFKIFPTAHKKEHSLVVQLQFLKKALPHFKIVPMLYGKADPDQLAQFLIPYLKKNSTLLIVSADLSHYLDYDTAKVVDEQTAEQIKMSEILSQHQSCGATAVNTAMKVAQHFGLVPQLLDMVNSGDVTNDKSRVVGYGAWVYDMPKEEPKLTGIELEQRHLQNFANHNKEKLLEIVDFSLKGAVLHHEKYRPKRRKLSDVMFDKGASFVTLTQKGKLRGCIGSVVPSKGIAIDIADNTYAAALHDNRFSPVMPNELENIDFTISLLTNFEPISFSSYDDLLKKIKPGVDGLLLEDGERSGLFLPAVWKQIPNPHNFLTELKIKAGLMPSYWSDTLKVFRFRTVEIKNDNN